ncbi:MAG: glycosyl transferase [Bacteroidetes bacterium]|nr:MAG: glycosyl transferase [Bacteroidota bacterium]RLD84612.1 MAG: glycosyl transferase [Bacteroidota bacterium]
MHKRKKLLQINSVVNIGSTGRITEEIGQISIKNGWESYIAYAKGDRHSKSRLIKIGSDLDLKLHGLKTRLLDQHGLGSRSATSKLVSTIRKLKPDVIHLHNIHGYYINIDILFNFLKDTDIPVVWTLYDCWAFTGHCAYFDMANCNRWEKGCYNCPQKSSYPTSWLVDNSENNYNLKRKLFNLPEKMTIVVHSKWLEDTVRRSFLNNYPIKRINNGINTSIFKPKNTSILKTKLKIKNRFVILGVANRWSKRKGFEDFVELSRLLKDDEVIVLDGVEEKQKSKLPSNIIVHKKAKTVDELAVLYSLADVYINPTHEDNFPTTNLEAMACGTPVITYNSGGSPEAVDLNTGMVVEKGDIEGLARSISVLKEKGKQHYYYNCIDRAKSKFNYLDRYNDYITFFDKLV